MRAKAQLTGVPVVPKDLENYLALIQNVQLHRGTGELAQELRT